MSYDRGFAFRHVENMAASKKPSGYTGQFLKRTARARNASGKSQDEFATLLGMNQSKYKQYETRTPLPHSLVPAFCEIARIDPNWLFTGRGKAPPRSKHPASTDANGRDIRFSRPA